METNIKACPFCGLDITDFGFHLRLHEDCAVKEEQRKQLRIPGKRRKDMVGLEDALNFIGNNLLAEEYEEETAHGDVEGTAVTEFVKSNFETRSNFTIKVWVMV